MSDKPETQAPAEAAADQPSAGEQRGAEGATTDSTAQAERPAAQPPTVRKQGQKSQPPPRKGGAPSGGQPTFDEVLQAASAPPPPRAEKREAPERPAPKKPAAPTQPSFADILASVESQPEPKGEGASEREASPREGQREGGQREGQSRDGRNRGGRKDERKGPIVVRKPTLGKPMEGAPSEPPPAEGAEPAAGEQGERPERRPERSEKRPPKPMAESMFAQPSAEESADFAAMFEQAEKQRAEQGKTGGKLRPGQRVTARIAHIGGEVAFLDLGGKGEGLIDLRELRNDAGDLLVNIGEQIEGYVLNITEGQVVVTRSVPKGAGREALQAALDSKVPVEGVVTATNKGGLEVDLGGQRGFCPASQIDVRFVEDQAQFVGQKLKFLVTEIRGGNAILSRRTLIEEERKGKAEETRRHLEVGAQFEGTVTSVRDFGAFVDLGGLEGLIHVSELSHTRVAHAQDVVKPGQKVRVQVLRIDKPEGKDKDGRIALSMKALEQDPWDAARPQLKEGAKLQGKIARLQAFGAFVELFPGVDGLVHVSALANRHVNHPREVVSEGETVWVQVESIDDAQKRVSLRRITDEEAQSDAPVTKPAEKKRAKVGDVLEVTVDKVEPFGVFVYWDGGKGLVPSAELGTPRGSENRKTHPVGTKFKASIVDIDERGRYRLSKVGAERAGERQEFDDYRKVMAKTAKQGFGTLGDLLRAKLDRDE